MICGGCQCGSLNEDGLPAHVLATEHMLPQRAYPHGTSEPTSAHMGIWSQEGGSRLPPSEAGGSKVVMMQSCNNSKCQWAHGVKGMAAKAWARVCMAANRHAGAA